MKLKQISIPIENAPGKIYEFTKALGDHGINLRAMNIVDSGDFGELRILVSDVAAARQILMQKGIAARVEEVIAVEIEDQPGCFASILGHLNTAAIAIKYAYACGGTNSGKAVMVFRFDDNDHAIRILSRAEVTILDLVSFGMQQAA